STHAPLFLQSSPAHRPLHSFPTRRSSDLACSTISTPPATPSSPSGRMRRPITSTARTCCTRARWPERWHHGSIHSSTSCSGRRRSEEHTSELQSRGHLVCRLLLEKKKKHK